MFIKLPHNEMHTMDGRRLIWLASIEAHLPHPKWDDNGFDTIDGRLVMIDFEHDGVQISDEGSV